LGGRSSPTRRKKAGCGRKGNGPRGVVQGCVAKIGEGEKRGPRGRRRVRNQSHTKIATAGESNEGGEKSESGKESEKGGANRWGTRLTFKPIKKKPWNAQLIKQIREAGGP